MFINPNVATITDFLTNNVDENNIQTNMRKFMWEEATKQFTTDMKSGIRHLRVQNDFLYRSKPLIPRKGRTATQ